MKTLQKLVLILGLAGLFASCQSANKVLSKSDKRAEIMNAIAIDESMSKEMMEMLMKHKMEKMKMGDKETMMKKHAEMMTMMKANPEMMKKMMSEMMNMANKDTTMMSEMCKAMMKNEKMMEMMQKMKGMDQKSKQEEDHKEDH